VAIVPDSRRDEKDIDREFAEAAPALFGALLNGLSAGLLNLAEVEIADKPRMADFALWAEACTLAYWPASAFMRAYRENINAAVETVIEASAVGDAVRRFMAGRQTWEGTASQLLALLTPLIPEVLVRERSWPKSARALSGKLRRAAPPLRKVGIDVTFSRAPHTGERLILITLRGGEGGNFASPPPPPPSKPGNTRKGKGLDGDAKGDASFAGDANATGGDANGDNGAATVTQTAEPAPADNHRKNNGFSQKGDEGDEGDANFATPTLPSGRALSAPRRRTGGTSRGRSLPASQSARSGPQPSAPRATTCSTSIRGGGNDCAFQQRDRRMANAASLLRQTRPALSLHTRPLRNAGERQVPDLFHARTGRTQTGLGNASGVLQSAL
jgi:hypothetical protein